MSLCNWRHCKQHSELAAMLVCRRVWRVYIEFIWSFGLFSSQFAVGIVSYARTTIIHIYFIAITFAGSLGRYLNTRPSGLVFKQLSRDPANIKPWKTMDDPWILSTLCASADTQRWNNVDKKKRWININTLNQRWIDVVSTLYARWDNTFRVSVFCSSAFSESFD